MSSTNPKNNIRQNADAYITPAWCIRRLLEKYNPPGGHWLDPCAAGGELIQTVKSVRKDVQMMGYELRSECRKSLDLATTSAGCIIGDFLEAAPQVADKKIDVVLTNPPFSLAEAFIRACTRISKVTILLMRINAIRGDGRHVMMADLKPGLFVLPDRPSFTGWGCDSTEYAWYVFGDPEVAGKWAMLGETSKEEISAHNADARERYPQLNPKNREEDKVA